MLSCSGTSVKPDSPASTEDRECGLQTANACTVWCRVTICNKSVGSSRLSMPRLISILKFIFNDYRVVGGRRVVVSFSAPWTWLSSVLMKMVYLLCRSRFIASTFLVVASVTCARDDKGFVVPASEISPENFSGQHLRRSTQDDGGPNEAFSSTSHQHGSKVVALSPSAEVDERHIRHTDVPDDSQLLALPRRRDNRLDVGQAQHRPPTGISSSLAVASTSEKFTQTPPVKLLRGAAPGPADNDKVHTQRSHQMRGIISGIHREGMQESQKGRPQAPGAGHSQSFVEEEPVGLEQRRAQNRTSLSQLSDTSSSWSSGFALPLLVIGGTVTSCFCVGYYYMRCPKDTAMTDDEEEHEVIVDGEFVDKAQKSRARA
ncbi:unnamed protein product [Amoebophrya sp. A120]|nr:unnamed protein product [Amoebophrya sp. A120]|eukprot:GSA120T00003166001.1